MSEPTQANGAPKGVPQAPGAPGWKEKPGPSRGGMFAVVVLAAGIAAALRPDEGGRRLDVYLDSAGIPTSCLGIIGPEVTRRWKVDGKKARFTNAECDVLERNYIEPMVREMQTCLPQPIVSSISYGEFIVYAKERYNTGRFCTTPMAARLKIGDHAGACKAIADYRVHTGTPGNRKPAGKGVLQNGRWLQDCRDPANKCTGLPKRRARDVDQCLSAL